MNSVSSAIKGKVQGYSQHLETVAKESDISRYQDCLPYFNEIIRAIIDDGIFGEQFLEKCISEEPLRACDLLVSIAKFQLDDFIKLYRMMDNDHCRATAKSLKNVGLEYPCLFLNFLSQLLLFGNTAVHNLCNRHILSTEAFHRDLAFDIDRITRTFQSVDYFGIDWFFSLCDRLEKCRLFDCVHNDLSAFMEGLPYIARQGIDEFISSFGDAKKENLRALAAVGIASDLTIPYEHTHTECDASIIRNRLLHVKRLEYLKAVADVISPENRRERALYIASGSDYITSYFVSDRARETILVDRLPFQGTMLLPDERKKYRHEYLYSKYVSNYSVEPHLSPSVGAAQYILWELEAMDVHNIREVKECIAFDKERGAYRIQFRLPGEHEDKVIYYYEVDACDSKSYSHSLIKHVQEGIDCYIQKAAVKIEIPEEILEIITSSFHPGGLMFVDDEAHKMLDSIHDMFTKIDDECTKKILYFESQRSMRFGYNEISIFQLNLGKGKSF
jgi:hypothetical protein